MKKVVETLKVLCRRPGGFAFRIGAEELVIMSVGQPAEAADVFEEIIRDQIEELRIPNKKVMSVNA